MKTSNENYGVENLNKQSEKFTTGAQSQIWISKKELISL